MKYIILFLTLSIGVQLKAQFLPEPFADFYEEIGMVPYNKKFKLLEDAIEKNPKEPWYYWMMASVFEMKGENDKAVEYYEKSFTVDSNFSAGYGSLARFLRYTNKDDVAKMREALNYIDKAIELEPTEDFYIIDRAYIYLNLGEFDRADEEANRLLSSSDFDQFEVLQLKIEILHQSGKKEELNQFVMDHDLSNQGEFLGTNFCLLLASVYEDLGELEKACKLYRGASEPYAMMGEEIPAHIADKLKACE